MNTQKSVFNKISKIEKQVESQEVELSEIQKVEFALINEIEKNVEILQDNVNAGNKWIKGYDTEVLAALRVARAKIQGYLKEKPISISTSFAEADIDNIIRQGKEIGVDMTKNMSVKRLQNAMKSLDNVNKSLDRFENFAKDQLKKLNG